MNDARSDEAPVGTTAQDDPTHSLAWGVETSVRYHERRQAYYERADAIVNSVNLIAGSGAVLAIAKDAPNPIVVWLAAVVAVISLVNLTMRSSHMAAQHAGLKQRFVDLLKRIKRLEPEAPCFKKRLMAIEQRRLSLEMEEPTVYRIVCVLAHNELAFAHDYGDEALWHIPWHKQLTAHFVRWEPTSLRTRAKRKVS